MSECICDTCACNVCDEETGEEICSAEMDEDETAVFFSGSEKSCPFYRKNDEYEIVRHQM